MSVFSLSDAQLDDRLAQIPALAGPREVEVLSGGLTNRNVKVTTPDGVFVARCSDDNAEALDIDRDAEHANTRAAAEAGVGAPVVDYRPDLGVLVIGYVEGVTLHNDDFARDGIVPRVAAGIRQLHDGPRFVNEFDMYERQPRYRATCRDQGYRIPDGYDDFAGQFEDIRVALAVRAEGTVPCNNDLLAENFIDDVDRMWLIDYEYSGNNDPCFELGNTWTECKLSIEQLDELVTAYYGTPAAREDRTRSPAGDRLAVRLGTLGLHPAGREPARVRLLGLGDGALRGRGRGDAGARVHRPPGRGATGDGG